MVSIVTCTIRDHLIDNVFRNFKQQLIKEKELIIVLNKDEMDLKKWKERGKKFKNVHVFKLPETVTSGEAHNFGAHKAKYDIVAKFDDDDYYSPYYLKGQIDILQKKDTDIIGKRDCYYYLEREKKLIKTPFKMENQYVDRVMGSSLIFKKQILNTIEFPKLNKDIDSIFQKECRKHGYKIYSTDRENYVCVRRANKNSHTWKIKDSQLKNFCILVGKMDDYTSYVTKPV
ncbi:glycosyltransferase [Oceanobacillus salinisoli]|uniref:glycosyltransferase n=1 Tax=Oceanobacillus salinisoli TaxID=2678611 RepID=UPI0018CC00E1|nr:glycosyltransferase [Oceanobacillus salinisoli]